MDYGAVIAADRHRIRLINWCFEYNQKKQAVKVLMKISAEFIFLQKAWSQMLLYEKIPKFYRIGYGPSDLAPSPNHRNMSCMTLHNRLTLKSIKSIPYSFVFYLIFHLSPPTPLSHFSTAYNALAESETKPLFDS